MQFAGTGDAAVLESYIAQDDYLNDRRWKYAERYCALAPWRGKWDVKFLQDHKIKASGDKTNRIQFSIDVLNVGNLLNSDWDIMCTNLTMYNQ